MQWAMCSFRNGCISFNEWAMINRRETSPKNSGKLIKMFMKLYRSVWNEQKVGRRISTTLPETSQLLGQTFCSSSKPFQIPYTWLRTEITGYCELHVIAYSYCHLHGQTRGLNFSVLSRASERKFSRGYEDRYRAPKSYWAPNPYWGPCR